MKEVKGFILLPPDAPSVQARRAHIEVRDVSLMDVPSRVVAETEVTEVALKPNGRVFFSIAVPKTYGDKTLSFRVHISVGGGRQIASGDLLTTAACFLPAGDTEVPIAVPVSVV